MLSLGDWDKTRLSSLTPPDMVLKVLVNAFRQEKEIKGIQIGTVDTPSQMAVYTENPKESKNYCNC